MATSKTATTKTATEPTEANEATLAAPALLNIDGVKSHQLPCDAPYVAQLIEAAARDSRITIHPSATTPLAEGYTLAVIADRSKNDQSKLVTNGVTLLAMPLTATIQSAPGGAAYIAGLAESRIISKLSQAIGAGSVLPLTPADYIHTGRSTSPYVKAFGAWLTAQARSFAQNVQFVGMSAAHLRSALQSKANASLLYPEYGSRFDKLAANLVRGLVAARDQLNAKLDEAKEADDEKAVEALTAQLGLNAYSVETIEGWLATWATAPLTVEPATDAGDDVLALFN